jgi:hypothetical protein
MMARYNRNSPCTVALEDSMKRVPVTAVLSDCRLRFNVSDSGGMVAAREGPTMSLPTKFFCLPLVRPPAARRAARCRERGSGCESQIHSLKLPQHDGPCAHSRSARVRVRISVVTLRGLYRLSRDA